MGYLWNAEAERWYWNPAHGEPPADEREPPKKSPTAELIELLQDLDTSRRNLDCLGLLIEHHLKQNPNLRKTWDEFLKAGGVTTREFRSFLNTGGIGCRQPVRKMKQNLRLIVDRATKVARAA
jgi:hypothetical protein